MRVTTLLFGIAVAMYGCSSSSGTRKGGPDGGVADGTLDRGGTTGNGGFSAPSSGGGTLGSGGAGAGGIGTGGIPGTGGTIATGGIRGSGGGTGAAGEVGAGGTIGTGGIVATGGIRETGGSTGIDGSVGAGGTIGTGGSAGKDGSIGAGGNVGTGGSVGTGGMVSTGGSAGTGGSTGSCAEPIPCEGFDNGVDANLTALISCLSPSTAPSNATLTLSIYGHHLATGPSDNAIVTVGSGSPLNGVPVTACHLNVQVPAGQLSAPGQVPVTVSPGGWILDSAPTLLTIR
jgi:hypothetical protein